MEFSKIYIYENTYLTAKKEIEKLKPTTIDKKNTIYVFINTSIEGGKNEKAKTQAYSMRDSGVAHVFNNALQDNDSKQLVIHEIGHALGLFHTFIDEAKNEIKDLQDLIKSEENTLKELDKAKSEDQKYVAIDRKYTTIQSVLPIQKILKLILEGLKLIFYST